MKRRKVDSQKEEIKEILKAERASMSPQEMHSLGTSLVNKSANGLDIGYIRTAIFPEEYNFDMPQPMSNISYCRFTDKQETAFAPAYHGPVPFTAATAPVTGDGSGILLWYPKTTQGPSLFLHQNGAEASEGPVPLVSEFADTTKWKIGGHTTYSTYFSSTALVAASINLQFCGQLQQESGYFVGGLANDIPIDRISTSAIEDLEYKVTCKPGDGIRVIYMPKDEYDYQFYPATQGLAHNGGSKKPQTEGQWYLAGPGSTITRYQMIGTSLAWDGSNMGMNTTSFTIPTTYDNAGPCIAIFWRGFPQTGQNTMRCETIRRFNGTPLSSFREIIDLQKPLRQLDTKKSTDVIYQLQLAVPQLICHSMRNLERIKDQVQRYIPNIGHLYAQGALNKGSMTMNTFAQQLALEESGQVGQGTGTGLIWE